jgi:micrococcal nuclease
MRRNPVQIRGAADATRLAVAGVSAVCAIMIVGAAGHSRAGSGTAETQAAVGRSPEGQGNVVSSPAGIRQKALTPVEIIRVIDGDTVEVRALIWLDQQVTTKVRLRGIDAPERNSACREEIIRADAATEQLAKLVSGRPMYLADITRDKYGGRVLGSLVGADGSSINAAMLASGHARDYSGGRRRGWC